jgi:hypothetical protein
MMTRRQPLAALAAAAAALAVALPTASAGAAPTPPAPPAPPPIPNIPNIPNIPSGTPGGFAPGSPACQILTSELQPTLAGDNPLAATIIADVIASFGCGGAAT